MKLAYEKFALRLGQGSVSVLLAFWLLLAPLLLLAAGTVDNIPNGLKVRNVLIGYEITAAIALIVLISTYASERLSRARLVWAGGTAVALFPVAWVLWIEASRAF